MKWLLLLALAMLAFRMFAGRWVWEPTKPKMRLKATEAALEHAQILLGVRNGAGREDIIEAHKRLIAMVHPDRGGTNEQVHEANSARDLLLGELARRNTE
jgi:DnaJ family protein C protein 19